MNVMGANGLGSNDVDVSALARIAERISKAVPLREVLDDVIEFIATIVACDSCMIYVLDGDDLVLRASKNAHPEAVDRLKIRVGQCLTGWVAEQRVPLVLPTKAYADRRFKSFGGSPEDRFEAFLSVPMISGGRLVGVINLQHRDEYPYSQLEIRSVATLAFLVGTNVGIARLQSENRSLARRLESCTEIEKATRILQAELNTSQKEAYLLLQRESRRTRKSMKEVALAIILCNDLKTTSAVILRGQNRAHSQEI